MKMICILLALLLCLCGCDVVPLEELPKPQEEAAQPPAASGAAETEPPAAEAAEPLAELVSLGQIGVSLMECDADAPGGPVLTLALRNGSASALTYSIDHASIGGVMCDPYWSCEVPAGETVYSEVFWSEAQLRRCGITGGALRLEMTVASGETALFDDVIVLPASDGAEGSKPTWENDLALVLAQTDGFTVTARQLLGGTLTLTVENASQRELLCTVTDVTVDGAACDPAWAAFVMAEAVCVSEIAFPGVTDAETVTMTLTVYDSEDHSAPTLFEETVTVP